MSHRPQGIEIQLILYMIAYLLLLTFKQDVLLTESAKGEIIRDEGNHNDISIEKSCDDSTEIECCYSCGLVSLLGEKLNRYWKIGIHWLTAVRNLLSEPCTTENLNCIGIDILHRTQYGQKMIKTFADKHTQKLYLTGKSKRLPFHLAKNAVRRLDYIDNATCIEDLYVPPSNRMHALRGDREGQFAISINDQWRICFSFEDGDAYDVEITDYH